ncbi:MAG: 6-phosphogluconolactonase [Candidatus Obscuribacterales bacterium]|nr:6-phosphogluconolactonase [Steroidobacteraceae bacterium]
MPHLPRHHEHRFPDSLALASALSGEIQTDLQEALAVRGVASLVVSGGNTPVPLFTRLAAEKLDWAQIWVTLADERWVEPNNELSNERCVREYLLQGQASVARFIALKNPAVVPEAGLEWTWRSLTRLPRPYDVVVLGMGDDGHFASLFPGSLGISRALDVAASPGCVAMHGLVSPHARISQNLAALVDARRIVLHFTGEAKWNVYQRAKLSGSVTELPIRAVLQQQQTPVDVFWSP